MLIDQCPLCGGEIKAVKTTFLSGVTIDKAGRVVAGHEAGLEAGYSIYCQNDHSAHDIRMALRNATDFRFEAEESAIETAVAEGVL